MKLEHKIGIAITCTFLCLCGAVIGLKMQEQTPPESPTVASTEPTPAVPEPTPVESAKTPKESDESSKNRHGDATTH